MRGLVDEDINPAGRLEAGLGDAVECEVGVPGEESALIDALDGVDAVFVTSRVPISRRVLEGSDLDLVAKIGTGIDNVDLAAAADLGIPVTYTPGANAVAVAEHTVCLLLSLGHRLVESVDLIREGGWRDELEPGSWLYGTTVGIVGFGNVGSRVARMLDGFQVETLAYDPYVEEIDTEYSGTTLTGLDDLLERADAVTVNAELTEETRGMIGERELGLMDESAYLVNTARGPIVDEAALIDALRAGELAGAGLDVFEEEPLPADSPLHDLEDVILTPHSSAAVVQSRTRTIDLLARNARALIDGDPVDGRYLAVDPGA